MVVPEPEKNQGSAGLFKRDWKGNQRLMKRKKKKKKIWSLVSSLLPFSLNF